MESQSLIKEKKTFFHTMAELLFTVYLITLYVFVDRKETLMLSKLAFLAFAGVTVLHLLQRKRFHLGKNMMLVYVCFSWMFISTTWAMNSYVASNRTTTLWQVFLLFFLVYNLFCENENIYEGFLRKLYIAGIFLIGYSIYTYGFTGVVKMMMQDHNIRLGKEISHENIFGMKNATTCIIAFYYLFYRVRHKLFHIIILSSSFLLAMSSGSRKALLMTCAGILFLVYQKYGIRKVYKIVAIVLVLALVFSIVIQLPVFETIRHRMEQLGETLSGGKGDSSSKTRLNMIKEGWRVFKERFLIGYGANNYRIASRYRTYSHNNFIEMLVDFGLIGFTLYYLAYWNAFKNLTKSKEGEAKALLCIFLIRFAMEMAVVTYYDKTNWIMLAIFLIKCKIPDNNVDGGEKNEMLSAQNQQSYN